MAYWDLLVRHADGREDMVMHRSGSTGEDAAVRWLGGLPAGYRWAVVASRPSAGRPEVIGAGAVIKAGS